MSDPHETHSIESKRRGPLSPEHKAKMVAGRAAAREKRIEQARRLLGIEPPYGNAPGLKAALAEQRKDDEEKLGRLVSDGSSVAAMMEAKRLVKAENSLVLDMRPKSTTDIFAGLTVRDCCTACGPNCVISGDVCVHPLKGGLQAAHYMKPDVLRRYNEAKNKLAHDALEKKYAERVT